MGVAFSYQSTIREFDWETINQKIETFCGQNAVPVTKLFCFQLIVEELVTNIIKYGKGTGDETIRIEASIEGDSIDITISDNTVAFNPLEAKSTDTELPAEQRSIGGLGLVLVRQKAKSLSYEFVNGYNVLKVEI